jgi:DNA primase
MSKSSFVDFKAVKAAINIEQVLRHYALLENFKRSGDNLSGPCPIHKGTNPTQFRVSVSKNVWNCFSECKQGGNVLDFIAAMEKITIHAAALKAVQWFHLDPEALSGSSGTGKKQENGSATNGSKTAVNPAPKPPEETAHNGAPNPPLKFRLEKLEREHPYLVERGLTPETVIDFGIGYCAKGVMAERIAIPIHNPEGAVVAYAGRFPGDPPGDVPKYKLPQGFRKGLEVFNIDRAMKEPREMPLVIVEGFFGCMKLHQHAIRKVVALMGSSMSAAQEELIRKCFDGKTPVVLMLDEDEAGRNGREDIAVRLAKSHFVRIHGFDEEGRQPEELRPDEVAAVLV